MVVEIKGLVRYALAFKFRNSFQVQLDGKEAREHGMRRAVAVGGSSRRHTHLL